MQRAHAATLVGALAAVLAVACTDRLAAPLRRAGAARPDLVAVDSGVPIDTSTVPDTSTLPANSLAAVRALSCPVGTASRVRGWIGPDGGSVGSKAALLSVPAGAVAAPTQFEVQVPGTDTVGVEVHALDSLGAPTASYQFAQEAKITVNLGRCGASGLPSAKLQVMHVDSLGNILEVMQVGRTDRTGMRISFPTPHLSGYVIFY
jgi:hypothetical protein